MFIELTMLLGGPIFINPNHIIRMIADPDRADGTLLYLSGGITQSVQEFPREVVELVEAKVHAI